MESSRSFQVQTEGNVTVLKFTEKNLNDSNIQAIGEELTRFADRLGQGELHLDFSDVEYLSTVVMAKLLAIHKRVTRDGGRFVLTNVGALHELFRVTRLDTIMDTRKEK